MGSDPLQVCDGPCQLRGCSVTNPRRRPRDRRRGGWIGWPLPFVDRHSPRGARTSRSHHHRARAGSRRRPAGRAALAGRSHRAAWPARPAGDRLPDLRGRLPTGGRAPGRRRRGRGARPARAHVRRHALRAVVHRSDRRERGDAPGGSRRRLHLARRARLSARADREQPLRAGARRHVAPRARRARGRGDPDRLPRPDAA